MKKRTANLVGGLLAASLLMSGITACGSNDTLKGNETAVVVNSEEMPLGEANFILRYEQANMYNYYAQFYAMYGVQMSGSFFDQASGQEENPEQTQGEYLKETATKYIQQLMLIRQHAEELGVTLTDEQIQGAKDAAAAFAQKNGEEVLTTLGATEEMVADAMELYAYSTLGFDAIVADVDTNVSDEEAQMSTISMAYTIVNSNLTEEEVAEKKEYAERFLKEAKKDTVFSDLASEINAAINEEKGNDDSNKQTYIYTTSQSFAPNDAEDTSLAEELKEAVKDLKDGKLTSTVVETEQGFYILRMDAVMDESRTAAKKETIIDTRKNDLHNEIVDAWIAESNVSIKKNFENLTVTDSDIYVFAAPEAEQE